MAKKKEITEVTVPVAVIKDKDGNENIKIFILDENQKFRFPGVKDTSPRAWYYGPSLIFQDFNGGMTRTDEYYVNSPKIWAYIGALMQVGYFVRNDHELDKQVPDSCKEYWKKHFVG